MKQPGMENRVSPKTQLYSFSGTNMTNMVYFAVFYHSR